MVGILLNFTQRAGHEHPHLRTLLNNYASLLKTMGMSPLEIRQRLNELLAEYGVSLG